jgi:hypothetical protein
MRRIIIVLLAVFTSLQISFAQQESEALEGNYPLNERFQLLKTKSQNYKDYKVIKETVLDSFWKIVRDSVASKEAALQATNQNIQKLNTELSSTQTQLKAKEQSMSEVVHDSSHINVLGIEFAKSVFITTVAVILGLLILSVALISGRLKMIHGSMKQREDAFNVLSNEFEDYKRKAMEKQTKLSRELQNERNRLSQMRGS